MNPTATDNPERDALFAKWGIPEEHYKPAPKAPEPEPAKEAAAAPTAPSMSDIATLVAESNRQLMTGLAQAVAPPPAPTPLPEVRVDDIDPPAEIVDQGPAAISRYVVAEAAKRAVALSAQQAHAAAQASAAQAIQAVQGAQLAAQIAPKWAALPDRVKVGIHETLAANPQYAQADFAGKLTMAEAMVAELGRRLAPQGSGSASTVESTVNGGGGSRPSSVAGRQNQDSQEAMARAIVGKFGLRR